MTKYVPIPAKFLKPCPKANLSVVKTNGDLAIAVNTDDKYLDLCNQQLKAIRQLNKAPPKPQQGP